MLILLTLPTVPISCGNDKSNTKVKAKSEKETSKPAPKKGKNR